MLEPHAKLYGATRKVEIGTEQLLEFMIVVWVPSQVASDSVYVTKSLYLIVIL